MAEVQHSICDEQRNMIVFILQSSMEFIDNRSALSATERAVP
eukprot:SAG31_NODE_2012_length_6668_cov_5.925407_6_plen_42_part_00